MVKEKEYSFEKWNLRDFRLWEFREMEFSIDNVGLSAKVEEERWVF